MRDNFVDSISNYSCEDSLDVTNNCRQVLDRPTHVDLSDFVWVNFITVVEIPIAVSLIVYVASKGDEDLVSFAWYEKLCLKFFLERLRFSLRHQLDSVQTIV